MKRHILFLETLVLLTTACSEKENSVQTSAYAGVPMVFSAGSPETKTAIISQDNTVIWSANDAICLFDGTKNNRFILTGATGSSSTEFSGTAIPDQPVYYALYPYSATASLSGTVISSELPSVQYSTDDGTFDTMLAPAVAKSAMEGNLEFSNIAGILKMSFTGQGDKAVKEIQIKATGSMAGAYTVEMTGNTFSAISSTTEASRSVRLVAKNGKDLAKGPYYLVILPGSYADAEVSVVFTDDSYMTGTITSLEIIAGNIVPAEVNLTEAVPETNTEGLYGLFMAGQDLYIGETAYNKDQFTESEIIHHSSGEISISEADKGHIIFLDGNASITSFSDPSNIIIVGNNPENKPELVINARVSLAPVPEEDTRIIFKNIDIKSGDDFTNQLFRINGKYETVGAFGEFVLDGCDITLPSENAFYDGNAYLDRFVMENCNVEVPSGSRNRYILHGGQNANRYSEVIFYNNVFFNNETGATNFRLISGSSNDGNQTDLGKCTVTGNTFINTVHSNTALIMARDYTANVTVCHNLFYLPVLDSKTKELNIFWTCGNYPATAECFANIIYPGTSASESLECYMFDSGYIPTSGISESPELIITDPFEGGDLSSWIPNPDCSSYGANR